MLRQPSGNYFPTHGMLFLMQFLIRPERLQGSWSHFMSQLSCSLSVVQECVDYVAFQRLEEANQLFSFKLSDDS
jgi:hypothetical protein